VFLETVGRPFDLCLVTSKYSALQLNFYSRMINIRSVAYKDVLEKKVIFRFTAMYIHIWIVQKKSSGFIIRPTISDLPLYFSVLTIS
jgi:hypothetical protein